MIILAVETSCDETAISLIETDSKVKPWNSEGLTFKILAHEVSSQIDVHREWGGVVPMLAKREHRKNLPEILARIMNNARLPDGQELGIKVDLIAVTYGPGLEPALWEGINFAKELSVKWQVPIVATDHMHGHMVSALLKLNVNGKSQIVNPEYEIQNIEFPVIALLISGAHTELVLLTSLNDFEILGRTRDDAVGEAFDKVARMMGLPYPGGPEISKLASKFHSGFTAVELPRPMIYSKDLDFSFSGLKTAVLYLIKKLGDLSEEQKIEIAYEFEQAVSDVLVKKTSDAINEHGAKSLLVGGGVIANKTIRQALSGLATKLGVNLYLPDQKFTGDNATMIGMAGFLRAKDTSNLLLPDTSTFEELKAKGNLALYK